VVQFRPQNRTALDRLAAGFAQNPALDQVVSRLDRSESPGLSGTSGSARSLLAGILASRLKRLVVLALSEDDDAEASAADLGLLLPQVHRVLLVSTTRLSPEAIARNLEDNHPTVLLTTRSALLQPTPLPVAADKRLLQVHTDTHAAIEAVTAWLADAEYDHVDLVTEPGEFVRRGGIIDVFPERHDLPVRIEFFDDTIVSLRRFDPLTQRSTTTTDRIAVPTRRKPVLSDHTLVSGLPPDAVVITQRPIETGLRQVRLVPESDADVDLGCVPAPSYFGNFKLLGSEVAADDRLWYVACGDDRRRERVRGQLGEHAEYVADEISAGFFDTHARFVLLTSRELYGATRAPARRHRFKGLPVDNLVSLRPGDRVVHIDYGVGVFEGTRRIAHQDIHKDYIVLRYAGKDRVYVPVENLGLIDRYVGTSRTPPRLDRIGGRSWLLARARAAQASAQYAQELLDIQARRGAARGFAFTADSEWHRELADSFSYELTSDQARAIDAVQQDMGSSRPMERLVCGDVGYGKTEIALRAALQAVAGMKQVALLVPTTILCYQHHDTFRRRLAPFPLRVEMLSRLTRPAQRRTIIADLATGKVDILIATHTLFAAAPRFRDLGLLIVDEEQKFGVRQKERIKQLRASIDVLSLTATPVPRTLHMTLAGLRDISTIHTPPPGRREIHTEVAPWDDALVVHYVARELERDGQVFFVHNRIKSLGAVEKRLRRLLPGVDLAVAHGQMPTHRMEDIYLDFASGGHQVLLSTAIVESGLDLPDVNTIIVDRADLFGLADLHQLRGRVGRASRQAYALFLTPTRRDVTSDARKRLSALLAYSQLGSGFRLAIRDLELRGAGDLLGLRQHGHVARVGLSFYARLLKEATDRLRGTEPELEPELKLEISAYLPEPYVADSFERVALYRRLLGLESDSELREFRNELIDRFGRYPPVVENLFRIALVRIRARGLRLLKVELRRSGAVVVAADRTVEIPGGIEELLQWLERAGR
jgi:transcription-repair coupling factor (superfamily II helicase)